MKRLIESADLNVEEFASAEEFLLSGQSQNSACLILDLRLSGMSGLNLQSQLQVSNPRLSIIFMSANADEISTARARNWVPLNSWKSRSMSRHCSLQLTHL
jgi:FixJ family two-component response regulator